MKIAAILILALAVASCSCGKEDEDFTPYPGGKKQENIQPKS